MRFLSLLSLCITGISAFASADTYRYSLDLRNVKDDKLQVELLVPDMQQNEAVFNLPKIIPGTYAVYNFGRFVSGFHAYDKNGKELPVSSLNVNSWKIENASTLNKITYEVA